FCFHLIHNNTMDDEEKISLCERILLDLDNIFKRDPNIIEFDVIEVAESTCNKSPVIYSDHHLALEKWCVPHLYEYAYDKMLNFKKQSTYNRTESSLLHQWTRILLLLNPDFTTAWNLRRDLLNKSSSNSHLEELDFTKLMLIRKPKCASVFTYREWLLNSFLRLDNGQLNDDLISNELQITLNAADQYSRNYYAWSHRTWLLTVYIVHNNDHHHLTNVINRIINDLMITAEWLEQHISDYSGFQHRQFLFNFIFFKEFQWLSTLWPLYPAQESLFLHRRHILHAASLWYPNQIEHLKQEELNFHERILSNYTVMMTKSEQNWQKELIRRYRFYLKCNLNWTFD
ncbi:Protein prenyltransferase alpha subunit repeat-containing protein 1, partial [Dermatophagoides pteronyssinus]